MEFCFALEMSETENVKGIHATFHYTTVRDLRKKIGGNA